MKESTFLFDKKKKEYLNYKENLLIQEKNRYIEVRGTGVFEKLSHAQREKKEIKEYDLIEMRQEFQAFNCGGDNTVQHYGYVVFEENEWQVKVAISKDYSYLNNTEYYVPLNQDGYFKEIYGSYLISPDDERLNIGK